MKSSPRTQKNPTSANWPIEQLPGLKNDDLKILNKHGISTTFELLQQTRTGPQKEALAVQLAVPVRTVSKWVAMADLARLPAVGCQYCGLLLHVGICSTVQLAKTPLHMLQRQMLRFQVQLFQRTELSPTLEQIALWIRQAQQLTTKQPVKP